jgi:cytochrome c oxidase subunit IV
MTKAVAGKAAGHQQHPLGVYLAVWILLFVLSAFSYLVDYMQLQGMLRWSLIILFMLLKAGLIISIFMHIAWERLALKLAILVPPLCLLVFISLLAIEADYTFLTRLNVFGPAAEIITPHH